MRSVKQNIATPDIAELRDELHRVGEMLAFLVNAAREGEAGSYTLKQFLARHKLSESQYHKLRRTGRGPCTMRTGSVGVRISCQAELDWIAAREQEAEAAARETAPTENEKSAPRPFDDSSTSPPPSGRQRAAHAE